MNRFIIVDGLPYLYVHGKVFAVRWDEKGFTVGAEVELASVPKATYPELSIKAKCTDLDSIKGAEPVTEDDSEVKKPLSEMSLEELKGYAKEHGIKLGGARTKDAIVNVITDALI